MNPNVWCSQHSTGILTGCSILGVLASVFLGCKGAIKASDNVRRVKYEKANNFDSETWDSMTEEEQDELTKLEPKELLVEVGKPMIPTVISVASTIVCIILSYKTGKAKYALAIAACKSAEIGATALEDVVKEKITDPEELKEFKKSVAERKTELERDYISKPTEKEQRRYNLNPSDNSMEQPYYFEGTWFKSTPERIRIGMVKLDELLRSSSCNDGDGLTVHEIADVLSEGNYKPAELGDSVKFDMGGGNDLFAENYIITPGDNEGWLYSKIELLCHPTIGGQRYYG